MDKTEKLIDWQLIDRGENERKDRNRNGLDDSIEPPAVDIAASSAKLAARLRDDGLADTSITSGDVDAQFEGAQFSGDESAVSSMTTPEQNQVDDIGQAMGVTYADNEELKVGEKERSRDKQRWELDPASADDWTERNRGNSGQQ